MGELGLPPPLPRTLRKEPPAGAPQGPLYTFATIFSTSSSGVTTLPQHHDIVRKHVAQQVLRGARQQTQQP